MKLLFSSTFFLVLVASPNWAIGASLVPASSDFCHREESGFFGCPESKTFVKASDGRCGCLKSDQYLDIKTCAGGEITCKEEEPFAWLYIGGKYAGCGCFETIR